MYKIIFKTPSMRFLKKLDKNQQIKIISKIKKLKENPEKGTPLIGSLAGLWKLRIEKYRIIYQIKKQELIIFILILKKKQ